MQCKKCDSVRQAYAQGRSYRLAGKPMNSNLYPGMDALNGAFINGWLDEDNALRMHDDFDDMPMSEVNVQQLRDELDWAKEYR